MTEEQKLERCISLIWDFGKIYDGDDIEQFQNAELSMYSEHDELVKYLEDLKVKAEATKELQEQNLEDCSTFNRKMAEELKQKAEEYAINMWGNDEAFIDERNNCKQDYITGAIENGIQWHVLRKDPNDLPKDSSAKRCYADDGKYYRLYFSNAKWHYSRGGYTFLQDIIAWCEEPQFK